MTMGTMPAKGRHWPLLRQCFVTANVSMTCMGNGCAVGIAAILIPALRLKESQIHASVTEESWIAASLGIPLIFGNIAVTVLIDKVGRRTCHFLAVLSTLIGWLILLFASNVAGLISSRLFQGFAIGAYSFLGSVIIGEMTDPKNRGIFLTMVSLSLSIGVLFTHALGSYFTWQTTTLICSFATFTSLLMLFYTPETPFWLVSKGRFKEARDIFFWLRGDGEAQETEFERMVTAQKISSEPSVTRHDLSVGMKVKEYFKHFNETRKKPEFYKPTLIMIFLYTMYQFSGVNVFSSFAIDIIEQVVGPESNTKQIVVALGIERLVCNILAIFLMKIMKRRTLLFSTGFGCVLSHLGIAAYVYLKRNEKLMYDSPWIPMTLFAFYMFTLTVGVSSVPFVLAGEIFPLEHRGLGSGISSLSPSVNLFLAVKLFPVLNRATSISITYILYGGIVSICLSAVWFLLPETKDRTLQDIEDIFRGYSTADVKSTELLRRADDEEA